jgi:hypothetical protein
MKSAFGTAEMTCLAHQYFSTPRGELETLADYLGRVSLDAWNSGNLAAMREGMKTLLALYEEDPAAYSAFAPFASIGNEIADELENRPPLSSRLGEHIVWARHRGALQLETLSDTLGRVVPEGLRWKSVLRQSNSAVAREFIREVLWSPVKDSDLGFLVQQLDALGRLDLERSAVAELSEARMDLMHPAFVGQSVSEAA